MELTRAWLSGAGVGRLAKCTFPFATKWAIRGGAELGFGSTDPPVPAVLYQINVVVPDGVQSGDQPVIGGAVGTQTILLQLSREVTRAMENTQKMAVAGSGLVVAGIGLGILGMALIVPAVFEWTVKVVEKGAGHFGPKLEGASRTVGTVAGTLHRSFNAAKEAGVAEIRRARSS
jgi:hypothetical protein